MKKNLNKNKKTWKKYIKGKKKKIKKLKLKL